MLSKYRTVYIGNEAEIVEKKSRFIATVKPVKSEEEAIEFIADDELIEITPKSIRLRKKILDNSLRLKAQSKKNNA